MDPAKVQAITHWAQTKDLKAVQCFLCFANFYRRFARDFSTIVTPIAALTKKGAYTAIWSPKTISALKKLKSAFFSAPVLIHLGPLMPFIVEVDALDVGIGAILSQWSSSSSELHPCAFFSWKFSSVDLNYDIGN